MKVILKCTHFGPVGFILASLITMVAIPTIAVAQTPANVALTQRDVTFAKDVAPIFQAKCQVCHRGGAMAPMSLVTFEETRPWAKAIKRQVETRTMPPWELDKTVGIQHFQNDPSLTDAQIDTIVRWVNEGAPQGNPKDMPPPKQWPNDNEWQLAKQFGQPDIVIDSAPYTMPARSQDVWWKPVSPVPITEPRWVRAVEIRPSTLDGRRIMHHVLARLQQDEPDLRKTLFNGDDADSDGPGMLMEWAVGKNYDIYRPNTGKLLLPGSQIWWELHLHAVGQEITDRAQLAIYLYPKGQTPKYRTYLMAYTANPKVNGQLVLDIPPNTLTETEGFHVLKHPAILENFQPHMHLRGKAMSMEAILPDGTRQMLSYVDRFSFSWMINYIYDDDAAPVLPAGTVLHITAWHDNTTANPNNPDPNQWVGYGERTVDEMSHAWVNVTYISDSDYQAYVAKTRASQVASSVAPAP
jgi:mono/diheme cytochrome c family protein